MRVLSILCALIGFGLSVPAAATTVIPLTDEALANGADMVVRGQVVSIDIVEFDVGPGVFTDVRIRVDERLDGTVAMPEVTLRIPGGHSADRHVIIEGMPEFELGQQLVVFLETLPPAFGDSEIVFIPHGLCQGVWTESAQGWVRGEQVGLLPTLGAQPEVRPLEIRELRQLVSQ